ncbi:hypothetical protein QWZ13_05880 [Reinekea marina]|nr:hypothetical protein [Reinekea marina]MDN3648435.1 hypothetical protein [Reinekea marina]
MNCVKFRRFILGNGTNFCFIVVFTTAKTLIFRKCDYYGLSTGSY